MFRVLVWVSVSLSMFSLALSIDLHLDFIVQSWSGFSVSKFRVVLGSAYVWILLAMLRVLASDLVLIWVSISMNRVSFWVSVSVLSLGLYMGLYAQSLYPALFAQSCTEAWSQCSKSWSKARPWFGSWSSCSVLFCVSVPMFRVSVWISLLSWSWLYYIRCVCV